MERRQKTVARKRPRSSASGPQPIHVNEISGPGGMPKSEVCPQSYLFAPDFRGSEVMDCLEFQWIRQFVCSKMEVDAVLVDFFYKHFRVASDSNDWFSIVLSLDNETEFTYGMNDMLHDFHVGSRYHSNDLRRVPRDLVNEWPSVLTCHGLRNREELVRALNHNELRENLTPALVNKVNMSCLSGDEKLLLKIVREILLPTHNKDNLPSDAHSVVLYCLKHKVRINFPELIAYHMSLCPKNGRSNSFPYGGFVTHIMKKWGIKVRGASREISQPKPINRSTYLRQGSERVSGILVHPCEFHYLENDLKRGYLIEKEKRRTKSKGVETVMVDEDDSGEDENEGEGEEEGAAAGGSSSAPSIEVVAQEVRELRTELTVLHHRLEDHSTQTDSNFRKLFRLIKSTVGCSSSRATDAISPSSSSQ